MESSHHLRVAELAAEVTTLAGQLTGVRAELSALALAEAAANPCPAWCLGDHDPDDGHLGEHSNVILSRASFADDGEPDELRVQLAESGSGGPVVAIGQRLDDLWGPDMTPAEARRLAGALIAAADDAQAPAGSR